ncbi:acyltransferase family protein [Micromonospora sp. NBC_01796]|uniref:acyltransferase family protein n=1 Tax=Micromonospora sp. NBC_01796 TaxID=2975987 RepID=UPI002DDC514A|nr:acyltransferase family protein [Micromonospora sp. NBC_01796]WSA86738.1 acyltransferase [Micromonospora sp. NBC_01796]
MTQLASRTGREATGRPERRGDIEGLRGLAVVLVLLCHAGPWVVPGGFVGVDVFFVISGFLVTGLLADELDRTGKIELVEHYGRRVRRLLPAALVVLFATLPLAYLLLPRFRWAETGWDVVASGLWVMNWRAAGAGGDQVGADAFASPTQHFWALAVGAQFHLIWPVLLLGLGLWAARRGGSTRRWLLIGAGVVALPSFVWSVVYSNGATAAAFFVTTTRAWELALGAGLALLTRAPVRLTGPVASVLGWGGLAAIALAALLLGEATPYPGVAALLPTLGAAAVIAAGGTGPGRLLSLRPVRAVGAVALPLYLWHWPLLVLANARFGDLHPVGALAVLLAAAALAVLTHRYVERPLRTPGFSAPWQAGQALRIGLLGTTTAVVAGLLFQLTVWPPPPPNPATGLAAPPASASPTPAPAPSAPQGAAVLGDEPRSNKAGEPVDRVEKIVPEPAKAGDDRPEGYDDKCLTPAQESKVRSCVYGDQESAFTVVLAGDSHAAQWLPALEPIARANKWKLVTYTKESCPLLGAAVARAKRAYPSCTEWNRSVRTRLTGDDQPQLLVTSSAAHTLFADGYALTGEYGRTELIGSFRETWSELADADLPTIVLRGTPQPGRDVPECVTGHRQRLTECTAKRETALAGIGPVQEKAASGLDGVHLINLNDAICPAARCAPVIGGILVYRDNEHLTASYAASLSPRLRAELDRVLA